MLSKKEPLGAMMVEACSEFNVELVARWPAESLGGRRVVGLFVSLYYCLALL